MSFAVLPDDAGFSEMIVAWHSDAEAACSIAASAGGPCDASIRSAVNRSSSDGLGLFQGVARWWSGLLAQLRVDASGLFELVFQDDDAARRVQGGSGVHQFARAGGEP